MTEKEFKEAINNMGPTERQKEDMLQKILNTKKTVVYMKKRRKVCLIAAVILVCVLATTGFAFTNIKYFKSFFGSSIYTVADDVSLSIVSSKNDNYKITVEGVLGDSHTSMIIVSVQCSNKKALKKLKNNVVKFSIFDEKNDIQASTTSTYILQEKNDKNYYCVEYNSNDSNLLPKLKLNCNIDKEQISVVFPNKNTIKNKVFKFKNTENKNRYVKSIVISPLSIVVYYYENKSEKLIPTPNVTLNFYDGTKLKPFDESNWSGARLSEKNQIIVTNRFSKIIDLDKLESITVN